MAEPDHAHHHSSPDDHDHEHTHGHEKHDFAAANRAFFDQHAHEHSHGHNDAHSRERAIRQVNALRKAWPELFDEDSTVAMDYACGTGLVSQQLCQYVKSVVGVDISQASVDLYNSQASNQGLALEEMRAVCAELKGEPGELDGLKFDIIVCCASYHHFPSIDDTTRILASFLKPGGSLLVADIRASEDGRELFPVTHHHLVPHKHGLSEGAVRAAFEGAGLVGFDMRDVFKARMRPTGEEVQWFVVRGVKAT
ncbi:S-adenosyl-L-methionine-dependent methyltransferase [Cerioporus squamosus]|nr:S-adenosyl-L-methionine-dependent methyltransferase [Cerioporus squamosus]